MFTINILLVFSGVIPVLNLVFIIILLHVLSETISVICSTKLNIVVQSRKRIQSERQVDVNQNARYNKMLVITKSDGE